MQTKQLRINSILKDHEAVAEAAAILRSGGVVAIPTETVYGLAASAFDPSAINKVFSAKGRPADNPLIVHISEFDMLPDLVADIPEKALELARRFWPGPLTMVLKKSDKIPDAVSAGLDTVAVRMPSGTVARAIIGTADLPLAAPSANLSGSPSPTTAAHVLKDMDGLIDAVVMSADAAVGVESTVISLADDIPRLLRPGAITLEMLEEAIGEIIVDPAVYDMPEEGEAVSSPGMKYKHYSPKTKVVLVKAVTEDYISYVNNHSADGVFALCFNEDTGGLHVPHVCFGSQEDEDSQAKALFSALRALDDQGAKIAYAHSPQKDGVGLAVYNRLIRAAAFELIEL